MNESLDSRQLKAFVVLAQTGSYTETAKQLFVTHSAISHSMRALEEQVGCRLLSKLNKNTILTEAGEALLHHARRALAELQQARHTLADLNQWGFGRLRLAADPLFLPAFLTPGLLKFHNEFPRARLQIQACPADEAASWLETNRADLVLAEKPAGTAGLEFIPLLDDRFQLVVNSAHPLAAGKASRRDEFGKPPCFLLRDSSRGRQQLVNFMARREIVLNVVGEIECVDTIKEFVKQTPAMSFLPMWSIAAELKNRTFTALSLGRAPFERTWGFLHASGRPLNHAEATLVKHCRNRVAELV